jgi:hypothetical protein
MEPIWVCICGREVPGECPTCLCGRSEDMSIYEKEERKKIERKNEE